MKHGPSLVIPGTILGSLTIALLGWFLAGQFRVRGHIHRHEAARTERAHGLAGDWRAALRAHDWTLFVHCPVATGFLGRCYRQGNKC